nr:MAG TPA: hypothetical protein [Caudoviricetes sp.]
MCAGAALNASYQWPLCRGLASEMAPGTRRAKFKFY